MRLHEIYEQAEDYYLGCEPTLKDDVWRPDLELLPKKNHHAAEALLETVRPEGSLPRETSVPVARNPEDLQALGSPTSRIYRVTAPSGVEWSDSNWRRMIQDGTKLPLRDQPPVEEWAKQYWAGVASPLGTPLWEGRAQSVRISGVIRAPSPEEQVAFG